MVLVLNRNRQPNPNRLVIMSIGYSMFNVQCSMFKEFDVQRVRCSRSSKSSTFCPDLQNMHCRVVYFENIGIFMHMKSVYGYNYRPAAHLLVTDDDAADFLQSQFSNDLRPFESGRCTYGLWLDVKGKVVADSFILCEGGEQFRILSGHSRTATIAEKLEQHIIADDVVVERLSEGSAIALIGDEAPAVLKSLEVTIPAAGKFVENEGLYVYQGRRSLEPVFELWSESADRMSKLKAILMQAGVEFVSETGVSLFPSFV